MLSTELLLLSGVGREAKKLILYTLQMYYVVTESDVWVCKQIKTRYTSIWFFSILLFFFHNFFSLLPGNESLPDMLINI